MSDERTMATLASIQVTTSQPEPPRPEPEAVRYTTMGKMWARIAALEAANERLEARIAALERERGEL